jgi:hypothetical protein
MTERKRLIKFIPIILSIILLIFLIAPVSSDDVIISNETGENWIRWSWDTIALYDIYIDNSLVLEDYTLSDTIATGLNPNELHIIELRDSATNNLIQRQYTLTANLTDTQNSDSILNDILNVESYKFWFILSLIVFFIALFSTLQILFIVPFFGFIITLILYSIQDFSITLAGTFFMGISVALILLSFLGMVDR